MYRIIIEGVKDEVDRDWLIKEIHKNNPRLKISYEEVIINRNGAKQND